MRPIAIAILLAVPISAQWLKHPTPGIPRTAAAPRTADGKPDLSGMWAYNPGPGAADLTRDLKPDEVQPWAAALHKQRKENYGRDGANVTCLPAGPLYSIAGSPEGVKIVQTPSLIILLYGDLAFRQIFLDGRELPKDPNPSWLGYSVGHWDGDTLVVDTNGFNDRTWIDFEGHPHSEELLMTERYQRKDFGHMEVEVTFRDPKVYAKPLTTSVKMDGIFDTEMLEFVCAENEKDLGHLVGTLADEKVVEVPVAILSRYTGEYEMKDIPGAPTDEPLAISVTLKEGKLEMSIMGGPAGPLIPISETLFSGFGGSVDFVSDSQGRVTHLVFRIVEGDLEAKRKP